MRRERSRWRRECVRTRKILIKKLMRMVIPLPGELTPDLLLLLNRPEKVKPQDPPDVRRKMVSFPVELWALRSQLKKSESPLLPLKIPDPWEDPLSPSKQESQKMKILVSLAEVLWAPRRKRKKRKPLQALERLQAEDPSKIEKMLVPLQPDPGEVLPLRNLPLRPKHPVQELLLLEIDLVASQEVLPDKKTKLKKRPRRKTRRLMLVGGACQAVPRELLVLASVASRSSERLIKKALIRLLSSICSELS